FLSHQGGEDLALVYLQLAHYLVPDQPLVLLSLADLYELVKRPQLAIKIYQRGPEDSPLRRNADIQLAPNLGALDRTDEEKKYLEKLIAERPTDMDAITVLGNIQRGRKEFAGCAETYSKAIHTLVTVDKPNWLIFYFRGICYERSKDWDKAEAD